MLSLTPQQESRVNPLNDKPSGILLVHEIYKSIQGESTHAGLPCVFIRLAVCHLRCIWCDTPHAFKEGQEMVIEDVISQALEFSCPLVELTGGEPLLQPEALPLMARLADAGFTVLLETSGAVDIGPVDKRVHIIMDLKCPDSGEEEANLWANLDKLKPHDELKFVIASRIDMDWALTTIRDHRLDERVPILISPVYGQVSPESAARWVLESGIQARLQLQLHKYIWDPNARSV